MTTRISSQEIQCLLEYFKQCIQQEDMLQKSFERSAEGKNFFPLMIQNECFFYSQHTSIGIQKSEWLNYCHQQHSSDQQKKPLSYGYPVCIDSDGRISPIFFTEVTLREEGTTFLCTRTSEAVELNTNVLAAFGFEPEEIKKIREDIGSEKHIPQKLKRLLEILPHPASLTSQLEPWNTNTIAKPCILNTVILYFDEQSIITRALLAELQKLKTTKFSKIKKSALPIFFHYPPRKKRSNNCKDILEVFPMNPSQEQSVHNALTKPLTVITGPPGTGKSQVVLNIIANAVYQNKTVLFASKNNKAVDVVVEKLNRILPYPLIMRMGAKNHRTNAKQTLQNLLSQIPFSVDKHTLVEKISTLQDIIKQVNNHSNNHKQGIQKQIFFFSRHHKKQAKQQKTIETLGPLQNQTKYDEAEAQKQKVKLSRQILEQYWLEKINTMQPVLRYRISRYLDVSEQLDRNVKNYRLRKQLDMDQKNELEEILAGLPVWVVTNLSVKNSLPFKSGLFDLVIIDEASQCDIASALPLLLRAKQAVVIGDPKQLRHISLLKQSQEESIATACNIKHRFQKYSYSQLSLYDLAEQTVICLGEEPLLLNMHYRSHHDIIGFSNKYFYEGKLHVATNEQNLVSEPSLPQGIIWHNVQGKTMPTKSPYCPEEVTYVVDLLKQLHIAEKKQVSFGVVTLFRMQMESIIEKIKTTENLQDLNLTVGTAHRFQGDEKDVIIFSLGVSEGVRSSTLRWIETTTQLLNVGITRAKSLVIIVGDKHTCSISKGVLHDLAEYVTRQK